MGERRQRGEGSIHQRKDGLWEGRLDITQPGEDRRRKSVYGHSPQEVRRKIGQLRRELDKTGDLPSSRLTVEKWMTTWLEEIAPRKVKRSTLVGYKSKNRTYISDQLGKHRLDLLKTDHVRKFDRWMETERGLSQNTRRQVFMILGAALDAAMKDGKLSRNVADMVGAPPQVKNPPQSMSPEQIKKVKEAAQGDRLESRWLTAIMLGVRQGECLGLGWPQVDFAGNAIHITQALKRDDGESYMDTPKSKDSHRTLWIPTSLRTSLEARFDAWQQEPRDDPEWSHLDFIWGHEDGSPRLPRADYDEWHALLDRAGVPRCPVHNARHSAATALAMDGIPVPVIQQILGHATIDITMRYIHPDLSAQAAAWAIADPPRALEG